MYYILYIIYYILYIICYPPTLAAVERVGGLLQTCLKIFYKATRPQSYKAARLQGYSLQGYKALIYLQATRLQGSKAAN